MHARVFRYEVNHNREKLVEGREQLGTRMRYNVVELFYAGGGDWLINILTEGDTVLL